MCLQNEHVPTEKEKRTIKYAWKVFEVRKNVLISPFWFFEYTEENMEDGWFEAFSDYHGFHAFLFEKDANSAVKIMTEMYDEKFVARKVEVKRYFCDLCKCEVDEDDIAEVMAMNDNHEIVEEWGDWCQRCRDRLSRAAKKWREGQ